MNESTKDLAVIGIPCPLFSRLNINTHSSDWNPFTELLVCVLSSLATVMCTHVQHVTACFPDFQIVQFADFNQVRRAQSYCSAWRRSELETQRHSSSRRPGGNVDEIVLGLASVPVYSLFAHQTSLGGHYEPSAWCMYCRWPLSLSLSVLQCTLMAKHTRQGWTESSHRDRGGNLNQTR